MTKNSKFKKGIRKIGKEVLSLSLLVVLALVFSLFLLAQPAYAVFGQR